MACCTPSNPTGAGAASSDSCKRVNYTLGMLLGVDDFVEEQLYNGSRRRELARELLGYGSVHGLQVRLEADGDKGPRLLVTPGMAWLPSGTPVCVDSEQCAGLNAWLTTNATAVQAAMGASPPAISLFVVLSQVQCLTDRVPIPGEPCRSDDELMAPSRITDSFKLELRLSPPAQCEENALRDFVEWLLGQPLVTSSPPLDEASFIEQLRAAAQDWLDPASPPTSPPTRPADFMIGSAPDGSSEALWRAALRLWATELRPLWMARADCGCQAEPIPPLDDAVLLAQLDIRLLATQADGGWQVDDKGLAPVFIDERRRPMLLSLRMLQELLLRQSDNVAGNTVVAETGFGQLPQAGTALAYARSDHSHGSPELPALGGDLSGTPGDARIDSLQGVPLATGSPISDGQVLTFEAGLWLPRDLPEPPRPALPDLAGDVDGPVGANRLASLQGVPLAATSPISDGQVLTFEGGIWLPRDLPAPPAGPGSTPPPDLAGDVAGPITANRLASLQGVPLAAASPISDGQVLTFEAGTWLPRDLPETPVPALPDLAGDLAGPLTANRLASLRGVPLAEVAALTEGQVLTFSAGQWIPQALPPAPAATGQFVERGTADAFQIVAAGEIRILVVNRDASISMLSSYAKLDARSAKPVDGELNQLLVAFRASVAGAKKLPNYIVKLTPVWVEGAKVGFRLYLNGAVTVTASNAIGFEVLVVADSQIADGSFPLGFQLEVSRF